ncbi:MAG: oxidoreductase [Alteromonadaceae bacterium]|nr:oxidoreductase [Alteromonadaceae bacterium]
MKNFALIGAAGYIAPRHMKAIKETGNNLKVAYDTNDSVGVIDSHFPEAEYFTEFERYQYYLNLLKHEGTPIDYVAICSPNYLHEPHMGLSLAQGAEVICEKPLVTDVEALDRLKVFERNSGCKVNTILQLRYHENILALKEKVESEQRASKYDVDLTYVTSRGKWYHASWKSEDAKSGGICTNIGVHFYDMLSFIFGDIQQNVVHLFEHDKAAGYLEFEKARVRWYLSLDIDDVPEELRAKGQRTFRYIDVSGSALEFSGGFTDLHTESYKQILNGNGYGLDEARTGIQIVSDIRNLPISNAGEKHSLVR